MALQRRANAVVEVPATVSMPLQAPVSDGNGRPGSYADVHTLVGRMTAWDSQDSQGSYTDVER